MRAGQQVAGRSPHVGTKPLAWEPRIFGDEQFMLFTSGAIERLSAADVAKRLAEEPKL